ncbi:hypothetical protein [Streptomyces sp. NPDC048272]|uniref:hypothetical protein n=1 Tax=Streptomyces sp. NPDC048272 TaxID=3154616 RepID=UPI00343D23FF
MCRVAQSARRLTPETTSERELESLAKSLAERLSGPDTQVDVQVFLNEAKRNYVFLTGQHVSVDRWLHQNLWRYHFTWLTRAVLDHFTANMDDDGHIKAPQGDLATMFDVSQPNVSKSLTHLKKTKFIWGDGKRSFYQVNPLYAFRWGSDKQRAALLRICKDAKTPLKQIIINVPGSAGGEETK